MRSYISKINDRNLQRKRESGLTSYALISALILACYKLMVLYPQIPFQTNFWDVIATLGYTFNIGLAIILIYTAIKSSIASTSALRLVKRPSEVNNFFVYLLAYIMILLPTTATSVIIGYRINHNLSLGWIIIALAAVNAIFLILLIGASIKEIRKGDSYNAFSGTDNSGNKFSIIIFTLVAFFIIGLSAMLFNQIQSNINVIDVILFGVIVYALPILIDTIMDLQRKDMFAADLENLEYEIHVKNLSDEEIRDRLQKKYMGFLVNDWIKTKQLEIDITRDQLTEKGAKIFSQDKEFKKLNTDINSKEHSEQKKLLKANKKQFNKDVKTAFKKHSREIMRVWRDNANFTEEETDNLAQLTQYLLKQFKVSDWPIDKYINSKEEGKRE